MPPLHAPAGLDLSAYVRPGDTVLCGQLMSEPETLTGALVAQAPSIGPVRVVLGVTLSRTFRPDGPAELGFTAYGGMGTNAALARAGRLDVLPMHYSALNAAYGSGSLKADVVLLQLRPGARGFNLGTVNDYAALAARHARVVLAEVTPHAPDAVGADLPEGIEIAAVIESGRRPLEAAPAKFDGVSERIAAHVAGLIPDGATIQIGVGAIPDAVLSALSGHRHLGLHSGVITDRVVDLVEAGVITNDRKPFDTGVSVANTLIGTRRLCAALDGDPAYAVREAAHTHGLPVLARLEHFHALNSALEVDLTGQVNAEQVGGVWVGGVGGMGDFVRGAAASAGGRSIIALPSTAAGGTASRIVAKTSAVTLSRSDVDTVVTEHGVAELKGIGLDERARRLIAIADPAFRADLDRSLREAA